MKVLIFTFEFIKFMLISIPLACFLYVTAHLYFEIKRLIK